MAAIRSGQEYKDDDAVFTCKSGLLMPVSVNCRPVILDVTPTGAVIAFRDISEQKKYQESLRTINDLLERQATTDPLTGIYNRRKLSRLLTVRDRPGGTQSDCVIPRSVRRRRFQEHQRHLRSRAGGRGLAGYRPAGHRQHSENGSLRPLGGEEFMILAPGCNPSEALQLAEKLRTKLECTEFSIPVPVTCSFGVSTFRTDDTDISLTRRADEALYWAKQNGRNCVAQR